MIGMTDEEALNFFEQQDLEKYEEPSGEIYEFGNPSNIKLKGTLVVMSRMRNRKSTNEDLVEELADCLIMLDQMAYIFGVTDEELHKALNAKMIKFVFETVPSACAQVQQ